MTTATQPHSIQMLHHSIHQSGMPHGLGLLTTVASLPPKYRSRYLNIKTKCEIPLDLSIKPLSPQIANDVPMATNFTEVYTEPAENHSDYSGSQRSMSESESQACSEEAELMQAIVRDCVERQERERKSVETSTVVTITQIPIKSLTTGPSSPKRTYSQRIVEEPDAIVERIIADAYVNPPKMAKTQTQPTIKRESTPSKPSRPQTDTAPKTIKAQTAASRPSKNKATRKLKFDEETSSPVSGTIIRPLEEINEGDVQYSNGDIDPKYNIVEITEETKAELAAIKNVIGDYICRLCRLKFEDAFGLAQHRCACIVLLEYRCPECGKQFNCPANLASHRRWHKPRKEGAAGTKKENRNTLNVAKTGNAKKSTKEESGTHGCTECGKSFKRVAYLRKHQLTHAKTNSVPGDVPPRQTAPPSYETHMKSYQHSVVSSASGSVSSRASHHQEEEYPAGTQPPGYDYDQADYMSDCSSNSSSMGGGGYGRLQIVESGLTEEENIAAAALTNLRNCASVIQHTTLAH